jgi:hypothetical protein
MSKKGSSHSVSLLKSKSICFKVSTKMTLSEQGALDDGLDDQRV